MPIRAASNRKPFAYASGEQSLPAALRARGFAPTGKHARRMIGEGLVFVNGGLAPAGAHVIVSASDCVEVRDGNVPVGRGALKLAAALDYFSQILPSTRDERRVALDLGASTGGFTQALLDRGYARVIAIDKSSGKMTPALASDPRVTLREGVDAKTLERRHVPESVDLVVTDVYQTSILEFLCTTEPFLKPGALFLCLLKDEGEQRVQRRLRRFLHVSQSDLPTDYEKGNEALRLDAPLAYRLLHYVGKASSKGAWHPMIEDTWMSNFSRTLLCARVLGFSILGRFPSPVAVSYGYREEFALLRWDWRPWNS